MPPDSWPWWLLLVPYRAYSIETGLSVAEVMRQVRGTSKVGSLSLRGREIAETRFKAVLTGYKSARLVVLGDVVPASFGARIQVRVRPNAPSIVILGALLGVAFVLTPNRGMLLLYVLLLAAGFTFEAARAKALLRALVFLEPVAR